MSVVLVVDSACDLPSEYFSSKNIQVLPINIQVNGQLYQDRKSDAHLQNFYSKNLLSKEHDADSVPFTEGEIEQFILDELVTNFDFVAVQTVASGNSPIYQNASNASQNILMKYQSVRQKAGKEGMFGIRVFDTTNVFTGQGLVALYTIDLLRKGIKRQALREKLDAFKPLVHTYAVPKSVAYIRERARRKGVNSVSALGALFGKALDVNPIILLKNNENEAVAKVRGRQQALDKLLNYAQQQVEFDNLLYPNIVVSYAGNLVDLHQMATYQALDDACQQHGIKLQSCVMNLTGGLNLGPEALCLSMAIKANQLA